MTGFLSFIFLLLFVCCNDHKKNKRSNCVISKLSLFVKIWQFKKAIKFNLTGFSHQKLTDIVLSRKLTDLYKNLPPAKKAVYLTLHKKYKIQRYSGET